ncbi:MAG: NUDIX domain-containing protein [Candidatus Nanoarchaeia archaeon]
MVESATLAVDLCVFKADEELKILLIKRRNEPFKGCYALPGGVVDKNEELERTASRELEEETGIIPIFLKKLSTYAKVDRDPRGRVASTSFLSLVKPGVKALPDDDAIYADWFKLKEIPPLAFDHKEIIEDAHYTLRLELQFSNIAGLAMPETFTLKELGMLYDKIFSSLDYKNFEYWALNSGLLKKTKEGRFCFKDKTYKRIDSGFFLQDY